MDLQLYHLFLSFSKRHSKGIFFLLFFITLFSCNKPLSPAEKQKAQDKVEVFFRKLPLTNKDSTIALIEANITNKADLDFLHERMLDTIILFASNKTAFPYIQYLETKIDTLAPNLEGHLNSVKGLVYFYMGKVDSSFLLQNKGIKLLVKGNDSSLISRAYYNISKLYSTRNIIDLGTENTLLGLKYVPQKVHDPKYPESNGIIKEGLETILLTFYARREYKKAKILALKMLAKSEPRVYEVLTFAFHKLHQEDSAKWAVEKCEHIYRTDRKHQTGYNALSLGVSFMQTQQTEKAITYFKIARHSADSLGNKALLTSCLASFANLYLQTGNLVKADSFYQAFLEGRFGKGKRLPSVKVLDSLTVLKLKQGNISEGLSYFYQSKHIVDSLNNSDMNLTWANMSVRYETSEKESRIEHLLVDKRDLQIQALLIAFLLLLLLSISVWLYYRYHQKQGLLSKKNDLLIAEKKLLESNQELLQSQQQTLEITKQLQEQEIMMHKQQLSVFQENMMSKNILITEMQAQMNDMMQNASSLAETETNRNKEKLNTMRILTEKDWRIFLGHFEKIYPQFIEKVEQHFRNLSKAESRLFLVMRLGLTKEELSSFLGISDEGVRKAKYRLKTKIGLSEEESIDEFILKF